MKSIDMKSCFINIGLVLSIVSAIGIFFIMCSLLGISDNQTYIVKGKVIYNNGHTVTLALNDGWEYNVTNRNDLHVVSSVTLLLQTKQLRKILQMMLSKKLKKFQNKY